MADIHHDLPIQASLAEVFRGVTTPEGLDAWWTLTSSGQTAVGAEWLLDFGPEYEWRAKVTRCEPDWCFELEFTSATEDWLGTRVSFQVEDRDGVSWLCFSHTGWREVDHHYRTSSYCWAMYLRLLRRHLEFGETVPYGERLDA